MEKYPRQKSQPLCTSHHQSFCLFRRKHHVSLFPFPPLFKKYVFFFISSISQNVKVGIIFVQCRDTFPNVKLLLLCLICHIATCNMHRYNYRNFCLCFNVPGTYNICYSHAYNVFCMHCTWLTLVDWSQVIWTNVLNLPESKGKRIGKINLQTAE